jgi:hypothetical protein
MNFISLILLLAAHYLAGRGLLQLFSIRFSAVKQATLAIICGVVIVSFIPFVLELSHIPITFTSVIVGIITSIVLLNLKGFFSLTKSGFNSPRIKFPSFRLYEVPFIILFAMMLFASGWRAYYFPPNARDMLSGPEAIAEYTVKEHTMINSVLSVNLETTNNHEKPPFVTDLQIVYKLCGFPLGQVWLAFLAISFYIFVYQVLRERIHPVLACTLMLLFITIPEVYAYSYVMLFDYSNMVLFFLGAYFMFQHFRSGERRDIYFSAVLFGFATYIRLETLVLVGLLLPAYWVHTLVNRKPLKNIVLPSIAIMAVPAFFYFLWINVYLKYYMPGGFKLGSQINTDFSNLKPLVTRFVDMHTELIFGKFSEPLWGHFINVFLVLTIADLIFSRKVNREGRNYFYAIAVVYFGLPLLGYLIPLVDLLNTTKRGLFKMFPFMLMVLVNNTLLQRLSATLTAWETQESEPLTKPAVKRPVPKQVKAVKR